MTGYHLIMNLLKISPSLLLVTGLVMTFITWYWLVDIKKKDQIMFFQSAEINYTNTSTLEKNWNKL